MLKIAMFCDFSICYLFGYQTKLIPDWFFDRVGVTGSTPAYHHRWYQFLFF